MYNIASQFNAGDVYLIFNILEGGGGLYGYRVAFSNGKR